MSSGWFKMLPTSYSLTNHNNSFICTWLNGFKYCYLTLIILFNITHSFADI